MPRLESIADFLRRLRRDTGGNVALLLGLMAVPLIFAAGVGIDYGRAVQFKTKLQSIADSAALAGANEFVSCSSQTTGTTAATNYVTKAVAALPPHGTLTPTYTPGPSSCGSSTTAFTMQVTLATTMPTTLMSLWKSSLPITTTATATNPVVTGTFDTGNFVSYACDTNVVYWYVVPPGGGVPAASAMNQLWSNNNSSPTSNVTFQIAASQKIGFAMKNITGARPTNLGGCNYGNNMYGAKPGDTQWLYSSLQPPSASYNIAPGGANTGTHGVYETNQDCALVVVKGTPGHGNGNGNNGNGNGNQAWNFANPPQGSCYTTSGSGENTNNSDGSICYGCGSGPKMAAETTNAAPSCSQLGGTPYQYNWNDMGASQDSLNYGNDMQYQFSCSGGSSGSGSGNGTTTSGLTLTN